MLPDVSLKQTHRQDFTDAGDVQIEQVVWNIPAVAEVVVCHSGYG